MHGQACNGSQPEKNHEVTASPGHQTKKDGEYCVCVIQSELQQTRIPKQEILSALAQCRFSDEAVFAITLALEEALTNAVKHGNRNDVRKTVTVRYDITDERAVIVVRDEGGGFVPEEIPDPTLPDRLPLPNGRGILLMKAYMDEVCYKDDGREVWFLKRRTQTD